jgi:homocysteine S-methyltransferase
MAMTDITLLDGSIGQELVRRTQDRATPLWSTQVMMDHPKLVGEVHADYFRVGATIATTNTYAVLADRLERVGLQDEVPRLAETAVTAALAARDAHGSGRVAGSLGPVGATYRPDIIVTVQEATRQYEPLVSRLDGRVDMWLIETVSSLNQAQATFDAVRAMARKPIWLSMTVDDDDGEKLRSGEPTQAVTDWILSRPEAERPDSILLNCSRPEAMPAGLEALKGAGLPFGAYANGFTRISTAFLAEFPTVDALEQRIDLSPAAYADMAMGWVGQGATIVGGCCEVGPDHIAELARRLTAAGHRIV